MVRKTVLLAVVPRTADGSLVRILGAGDGVSCHVSVRPSCLSLHSISGNFCNFLDRRCHFHKRPGWHLDWLRLEIPLSLKPSATCFSTFSSLLILDPPSGRLPTAALLVVLMSASCLVWVARQIAWSFASRWARRCSHQLCTVITSRVS